MASKKSSSVFDYEIAVAGGGPMGLCTALECAKAGKKVILFERFVFFNQSGSSNDYARMYRTMYTEDYMADFMHVCMKFWDDFEKDSGEGNLILKTGLLNFGDPTYGQGGPEGTLEGPIPNLQRYGMPFTELSSEEICEQYPFKDLPKDFKGVFAPDNGCINLPLLLRTLYRMCGAYGATMVQRAQVDRLVPDANGVDVHVTLRDENSQATSEKSYRVQKVALTAGAYTNQILSPSFGLSLDLDIWEMEYAYYSVNPGPRGTVFNSMWFQFAKDSNNDWRQSNLFYGFPVLPWGPSNLCRIAVDNAVKRIKDPSERGLAPSSYDLNRVQTFLETHVPGAVLQPALSGTCLQTNLPDNLYALGYLPGHENIAVFAAGWAMKAVPLIGWIMKELLCGDLQTSSPELADIVFTHFPLDRVDPSSGKPILAPDVVIKDKETQRAHPLMCGSSCPRVFQSQSAVAAQSSQKKNTIRKLAAGVSSVRSELPPAFSRGLYARRLLQNHKIDHPNLHANESLVHVALSVSSSASKRKLLSEVSKSAADVTVGIVGAGMAGLYASLLLQDLGIKSTVFEANPDRIGGRVYTYRFDPAQWQASHPGEPNYYNYIDVGAMRIPRLTIMERLSGGESWSLINFLNRHLTSKKEDPIKLIPYTFGSDSNVKCYNGIRMTTGEASKLNDPFHFSDSKNGGPGTAVPDKYSATESYSTWLDKALGPFTDLMTRDFNTGFDELMKVDSLSTRSYLYGLAPYDTRVMHTVPGPILMSDPLPPSCVDWMETLDTGTGLYDEAWSETVMDAFDFSGTQGWDCVEGGMDRFVYVLADYLTTSKGDSTRDAESSEVDSQQKTKKQKTTKGTKDTAAIPTKSAIGTEIHMGHKVERIRPSGNDRLEISGKVKNDDFVEEFSHVINTAPLSIQRQMDMTECSLTYLQREAMRSLHYDFSGKVCLKFKTRFWEQDTKAGSDKYPSAPIMGGQSSTDNPLRTIVYPSYGCGLKDAPGVMIASYTWAQDAARMGTLCGGSGGSRDSDVVGDEHRVRREEAVRLCLRYLCDIHGTETVMSQYTGEYYIMDWYSEPYAQGAFALYGPAQFTGMFPHIVQSAAKGRLHFAGEATSVHHAWIVGALNSAYRTVFEILEREGLEQEMGMLVERWGTVDEVDYGRFDIHSVLEREALLKANITVAKKVTAAVTKVKGGLQAMNGGGSTSSGSTGGTRLTQHIPEHCHKRM